jgi:hypothetical protein
MPETIASEVFPESGVSAFIRYPNGTMVPLTWDRADIVAQLWSQVEFTPTCWVWRGYRQLNGYGNIERQRNHVRTVIGTHRLSFELAYGPIPEGMEVCHRCDVRRCVRPDHLFLGTHAENVADMWSKGRGVAPPRLVGLRNHNARLGADQIAEIRRRWAAGGVKQRDLALEYGVGQSSIWRFVHGLSRVEPV